MIADRLEYFGGTIPPIATNPSALLEDLDSVAEVSQSGYK
jgi:hypothetical protein